MGTKILFNFILVGVPEINIMGAAYSTFACYVVIVTLNIIALVRHSGVMPNLWITLGKPIIAGVSCMATAMLSVKLLQNIEDDRVFKKDGDKIWVCRNCGHIVIGKDAPEVCPVCAHPQSYFEIKAENY